MERSASHTSLVGHVPPGQQVARWQSPPCILSQSGGPRFRALLPTTSLKEFALGVRSHITTADQVAFEVVPVGQLDYLLEEDEQPLYEQALVIADVGNQEEMVIFGTLGELTTLSHEMSEHCWATEQRTTTST